MANWIELPDVPKHLEGRECWKWIEGKNALPWIDTIPRDYSRDRHHCGGVWVALLVRPLPPELVRPFPPEIVESKEAKE